MSNELSCAKPDAGRGAAVWMLGTVIAVSVVILVRVVVGA